MGDVKMRRENIRYEARGRSFEIECPSGFSGIEAIVCWCDAGAAGTTRPSSRSSTPAVAWTRGCCAARRLMAYVQRTVVMNTADAIDPGIEPVMSARSGRVDALPPQGGEYPVPT